MTVTTRFAPAPTGRLHAGNLRTAILNWLLARAGGGQFLLRLDDTDAARSTPENASAIRQDLAWLGLVPDAEVAQSQRFALYEAALARLAREGRAYRAYEAPEELEIKRRLQLQRGEPPVYDRAALALTDAARARIEAEGVQSHWRFKLDREVPAHWDDLVRGPCTVDPASLSDPVIRRADGSWLYMLPSVVDDIDLGVTHVLRGEDHVTNTGIQLQMFAALGAPAPAMAHTSLLVGAEGALSKRLGSLGIDSMRAAGIEPVAVMAYLARLGSSDPVEPFADPAQLIAGFDPARLGRAPARFDLEELRALSARTVHLFGWRDVRDRLPPEVSPALWDAVRGNLGRVDEAAEWAAVVEDRALSVPVAASGDADLLRQALALLPAGPWDEWTWSALTGALAASTGRKGRALFHPLRLALTGKESGPGMAALLPLIGRARTENRLRAAIGA